MLSPSIRFWLLTAIVAISLLPANAQTSVVSTTQTATSSQSASNMLTALPEADSLIYLNPQKILTEVAPKVMQETELTKMRAAFEDLSKNVGIDPSKIDFAVMAVRFHKPTGELNFVPPDFLVVTSGDFSADSLLTLARLYLQDKAHEEKYGSKNITLMQIDQIATEAEKNPLLKSFSEIGAVSLNANTIAIGNAPYLKSAIDAAAGNGRINPVVINSLLRDPNALISVAGSPLAAFAKSFGMLGTETTARESNCQTKFGDFYAGITLDSDIFRLRGALNADNPDTAKIISNLVSSLWPIASSMATDKGAEELWKAIKLLPQNNEVTIEADVPQQVVSKFIREQMASPKPKETSPSKPVRKSVHRRRPVKK